MSIAGIFSAAAVVGVVGIFVGLFLGVAGIRFHVEKDEKEIREYKVEQLKFKPKRKKEKIQVQDDELRKLEALEKTEGKSKLDDN